LIVGITRVRNEELILADTLAHFQQWCDQIILYDDCSTDDTVTLALDSNAAVIAGDEWRSDRVAENTRHRKRLFDEACRAGAEWVLCFDADERLEGTLPELTADAYTFRLYDGYMADGYDVPYTDGPLAELPRLWGPEYRDIRMLFRANPQRVTWARPGMRQPDVLGCVKRAPMDVRHYGKCLSVKHWEETCDYYIKHFPQWRAKWWARKGKAIHSRSDFLRPLVPWERLNSVAVPL
jgi:glycosyltransferase involved in cell wall biosynthesis